MAETREELEQKVQAILDRERWQGYVSGQIDGALSVLYAIDLDKEKRIGLLADACGLSYGTAEDYIKQRETDV